MTLVALAQFTARHDRDYNLAEVTRHIADAGRRGIELVCFHELANTIYFCFRNDPAFRELAEAEEGTSVTEVRRAAAAAGVAVVYPYYEAADGGSKLFNTALAIDSRGEIVGRYRKMSIPQILRTVTGGETPADERFYFLPGDLGFPVFDLAGLRVGVLICYDRHFPEAARALALGGAELMLVPTATYRPWIRDVWQIELAGHAVANGMFVGGVNRVGEEQGGAAGRHYFGSSMFIDPMGRVLATASDQEPQLLSLDVDPAVVRQTRDLWGFFGARRPDSYTSLTVPVPAAAH